MTAASTIEKLPSEILIMILQSISSPIDIQSLINASPVLFQLYLVHYPFIIAPIIHRIEAPYLNDDSGDHLIQLTKILPYRLLGRSYQPFARQEFNGSVVLAPSDIPCYLYWGNHLPMICELYHQREEANNLIAEFAAAEWDKFVSNLGTIFNGNLASSSPPALPRQSVLSEQEKPRFERAFLLFDSWRLGMYSCGMLQDHSSSDMLRPGLDSFGLDGNGYRDHDFLYLLSIFAFVFYKLREFVHKVAKQLQEHPHESQKMACSGYNRIWEFQHRTPYQELRYIKTLCYHGYAELRKLRCINDQELQDYVLSGYFESLQQEPWRSLSSNEATKGYFADELLLVQCLYRDGRPLQSSLVLCALFWDTSRVTAHLWGVRANRNDTVQTVGNCGCGCDGLI